MTILQIFRLLKQRVLKRLKPDITFLNSRFTAQLGDLWNSIVSSQASFLMPGKWS